MDLKAEKDRIKSELDEVDDINLLRAIESMLAYGRSGDYGSRLRPMTKDTFYKRNEESRKAIQQGNLINQEAAKDYFKKDEG